MSNEQQRKQRAAYMRQWTRRPENRRRVMARNERWRLNNMDKTRAIKSAWKRRNREKCRANWAVHTAVKLGILVRPSRCGRCGCRCVPQAHHKNYRRKLEVEWLCYRCHGETRRVNA